MPIAGVKVGDIVEVDKKGRRFHAVVTNTQVKGELGVAPIPKGITFFTARAQEVVGHWRRAGRS